MQLSLVESSQLNGEDAGKAKGIVKVVKTEKFCQMLCFMLDGKKTVKDLDVQFA